MSAFVVPQPQPAEIGGDEKLQSRLHHNAHVVRNHEVNRRFFEDLLVIPLVVTCCEKTFSSELNREIDFCHTFFGMGPHLRHRLQGRARDL
jgi:hypothetical protein